MNAPRALQLLRVVFGGFLIWLSWEIQGSIQQTAEQYGSTGHWAGWPLIGSLSALELTFWTFIALFILGVFLMGGLLVRMLSALTVGMAVASFGIFGMNGWLIHGMVLVCATVIMLRGGGAGTMDSALGAMQRRSIEREAEREAERQAARALREQDTSGASA
ncbi:MAG: hypothetical protein ACKVVP_03815 [Chloroflexota bacterium]